MLREGKLNLRLFLFMILFVVIVFGYVVLGEIQDIDLISPQTYTNTSNQTTIFYCNSTGNYSNISLWANDTGTWMEKGVNNTITINGTITGFNISGMPNNVSFIWNCKAQNSTVASVGKNYNFSKANFTVYVDAAVPSIVPVTPDRSMVNGGYNFTDFPIKVEVNVTDERFVGVHSVWGYIAERSSAPYGTNVSLGLFQNKSITWTTNITVTILSNTTNPGPHAIWFCANDTAGNVACNNFNATGGPPVVATIEGTNVSVLNNYSKFVNGTFIQVFLTNGSSAFASLPAAPYYMNPSRYNYTLVINFTDAFGARLNISIVGLSVNSTVFSGLLNNTQIEGRPTVFANNSGGEGFNQTSMWAELTSWLPNESVYRYAIVSFARLSDRVFYCNNTLSSPLCNQVNECSGAVSPDNHAAIVTGGSGCRLNEGGVTKLYADHLTGGTEATDDQPPNIFAITPIGTQNFTNETNILINVSFNDTGVGLDNNSINITVAYGYTNAYTLNFTLKNGGLQCNPTLTMNLSNTTVYCWVSLNLSEVANDAASNSWFWNATIRDGKGKQQNMTVVGGLVNLRSSGGFFIIDLSPPKNYTVDGTNFGGVSLLSYIFQATEYRNTTNPGLEGNSTYFRVNWNDSASLVVAARLEYYNTTSGQWEIANYTTYTGGSGNNFQANISWVMPSGHTWFAAGGKNVSFRMTANDTVGLSATTSYNLTVHVNDTTAPSLVTFMINGTNGTRANISSSYIKLNFTIQEAASLKNVIYRIDGWNNPSNMTAYLWRDFNRSVSGTFDDVDSLKVNESLLNQTLPSNGSGLGDGIHFVNITIRDDYDNIKTFSGVFNFTIDTRYPNQSMIAAVADNAVTVNDSDTRSLAYFNVTGFDTFDGNRSGIMNRSYSVDCDSTGTIYAFTNFVTFQPFNVSGCTGRNSTFVLTINVTDYARNSNITKYRFPVDDVVPVFNNFTVSNGTGNMTITWDTSDAYNNISATSVGFYLDSDSTLIKVQSNLGALNTTNYNFAPGYHTLRMHANDTVGNEVNSSLVGFFVQGNQSFDVAVASWRIFLANRSKTNATIQIMLQNGTKNHLNNATVNQTIDVIISANSSTNEVMNITLEVNASRMTWNQNFSLILNDTVTVPVIESSYKLQVRKYVLFNETLDHAFADNDSYFGIVDFPSAIGGDYDRFIWFPSRTKMNGAGYVVNISSCAGLGIDDAAFTSLNTVPCYNSSNGKTKVFVPHFGAVAAVNSSMPPNVTITTPSVLQGNASFIFNLTVSGDATSCRYYFNRTAENYSMTLSADYGGFSICYTNITHANRSAIPDNPENVTFYVTDAYGNLNKTVFRFTINDTVVPNTIDALSTNIGSSNKIVISFNTTEHTNTTLNYGTTTALGTASDDIYLDTTHSFNLNGLSTGTLYYFNFTYCDVQGNCRVNGTFNATTETGGSGDSGSSSSSSGGGGGGGGAGPGAASNYAAKASKFWTSIASGVSGALDIENDQIAITHVGFTVNADVDLVTLFVYSLKEKPTDIPGASSKVFQYLEVKPEGLENKDITSGEIKFKVDKQWLVDNGASSGDVVLYHYTSAGWVALPTQMVKEDEKSVSFTASTPGFSYFAIGTKIVPPTTTPTEEKPTTPTTQPPQEKPPVIAPPVVAGTNSALIGVIIVVIVLLVGLIGYYIYERKKTS